MKLVSVNLLGYNTKHFLKACLDSILAQTYPNLEINYLDNYSDDGSVEFVRAHYQKVRVFPYDGPRKAWYAKVHNWGIDLAGGDYIVISNVDLYFEKDYILKCVRAMEKHDRVGSANGKLYLTDENHEKTRLFDTTGIFPRKDRRVPDRGHGDEDRGQYDSEELIFSATGAATIYKREMLEDVQVMGENFDPDFIAYREEVDHQWRGQLLGWQCLYVPTAIGYHKRSYNPATRKKASRFTRQLVFRNRYLMMMKNDSWKNIFRHLPYLFAFEAGALFYVCLREPHLFKAYYQAVKLLPRMLKKRKEIMKRKKVPDDYIVRWFR